MLSNADRQAFDDIERRLRAEEPRLARALAARPFLSGEALAQRRRFALMLAALALVVGCVALALPVGTLSALGLLAWAWVVWRWHRPDDGSGPARTP